MGGSRQWGSTVWRWPATQPRLQVRSPSAAALTLESAFVLRGTPSSAMSRLDPWSSEHPYPALTPAQCCSSHADDDGTSAIVWPEVGEIHSHVVVGQISRNQAALGEPRRQDARHLVGPVAPGLGGIELCDLLPAVRRHRLIIAPRGGRRCASQAKRRKVTAALAAMNADRPGLTESHTLMPRRGAEFDARGHRGRCRML